MPQTFYGENVVLTATFSATANGSAPMTGTVMFYDGTTYLGSRHLVATSPSAIGLGRVARWPADRLGSGQLVDFVPDGRRPRHHGRVLGRQSTTPVPPPRRRCRSRSLPATTSTTLTASTTPQGTILTANVVVTSPGNPPIVGNVSFYDGTTLLGTVPVTDGVATLNVGTLSAGIADFQRQLLGRWDVIDQRVDVDRRRQMARK